VVINASWVSNAGVEHGSLVLLVLLIKGGSAAGPVTGLQCVFFPRAGIPQCARG
jgi:hypothetical protein